MKVRLLLSKLVLSLVLLGLIPAVLSCAPVETGPRAWIDWPRDGYAVAVDTTVTVISHAYAREGVAEVQLAVNGEAYRLVAPAGAGEQFVEVSLEWVATEPGDHLLSVTAFDVNGRASLAASVTVTVPGEVATPLLTPTEIAPTVPPGETPPPPTGTPVPPTGTPPPPTATPPAPTVTPVPPTPVPATPVPPTVTPVQPSPTPIPPSPTPDTEGPPAPALVSPTGGEGVPCADVTLDWNAVSDPSGIGTYYVKWEREVTPGNWQSLGGQATSNTAVTISLGCGISYRWSVRAEDGAGNPGAWASWAEFGVTFG